MGQLQESLDKEKRLDRLVEELKKKGYVESNGTINAEITIRYGIGNKIYLNLSESTHKTERKE